MSNRIPRDKRVRSSEKRLLPVRVGDIRINPVAQRTLNPSHKLFQEEFDLDKFATPHVNHTSEGHYHAMDGQHSLARFKEWWGDGWEDVYIDCWVYDGLSDAQEAEKFLALNNRVAIDPFSTYAIEITAGDPKTCEIDRVIRANGAVVSKHKVPGAIRAPGTVKKIHSRAGSTVLGRSVRIALNAYGDRGLDAIVLEGFGLMCQRFNGQLDDSVAIDKLSNASGGVARLLQRAVDLHNQTGNAKTQCVAAAAVEIINRGRGGGKLPNWWKS